jgi:multicomponent Na+:H+ antiporter subunit E
MKGLVRYGVAIVSLWALWFVLTGSTDPQEIVTGGVVAVVVAFVAGGGPFTDDSLRILEPKRLGYALAYIPYMVWAIAVANWDVAKRVISPELKIKPGIVKVKTRLKHPTARMILANSITLTPGTITLDIRGDELWIHWIDVQADDIEGATKEIVAGFEKYLEVIFG